jgi:hypothetical protein
MAKGKSAGLTDIMDAYENAVDVIGTYAKVSQRM